MKNITCFLTGFMVSGMGMILGEWLGCLMGSFIALILVTIDIISELLISKQSSNSHHPEELCAGVEEDTKPLFKEKELLREENHTSNLTPLDDTSRNIKTKRSKTTSRRITR